MANGLMFCNPPITLNVEHEPICHQFLIFFIVYFILYIQEDSLGVTVKETALIF